jgi:hypothetical protein
MQFTAGFFTGLGIVAVIVLIIYACTKGRQCPICEGTRTSHRFNCPYGKP